MLVDNEMSFAQMTIRFGEIIAYGHLEQIERASGISPRQMTDLDCETRLTNALRAQDNMMPFSQAIAA